ncbi:hypothetical protein SAMN04488074_12911 [Lentzea albidocapillata subsp. violacea]|uniref:Uncharacterized protein n=1 Tax=Lentzea albidocapillata subsp. violacea TaxID=128104 RepID=A0A1G9X2F1_9PSEU|nr:hypothetical protein [Lentzea albidocapillata]SDM90626.1 hypothetical protein SAMN04488074_12911 [Lentzea albidocapillata subsp. violacea]
MTTAEQHADVEALLHRTLAAHKARGTAVVVDGAEDEAVRQRLVAKVPEVGPFLATPIRTVNVSVPTWRVTDIPNGWLPGKEFSA